jgi:hypothetical protein
VKKERIKMDLGDVGSQNAFRNDSYLSRALFTLDVFTPW